MTNEMAQLFNFRGKGGQKRFAGLRLKAAVCGQSFTVCQFLPTIATHYHSMVSQCILEHNREISNMLYKLYPNQRRPAGHLAEEVDNMLSVNGKLTLVAQVLHKDGLAVCVKDIHNRKRKLAEAGSSLPELPPYTAEETSCVTGNTWFYIYVLNSLLSDAHNRPKRGYYI